MEDLWRLSAADLASLIKSKKVSAKEAATAALARLDAVNPRINAVIDHRPSEVLAQAAADRCRDRARRGHRSAGRRAGHHQGECRPGGVCHHQRIENTARRHREPQQPGGRKSAQGRRRAARPHQLPGLFLPLVHHQPAPRRYQEPARSRHHAGRLVGWRRRRRRRRHRPYRARHRHRRIDPLSRLRLRCARPAADDRAHPGLQSGIPRPADRPADQRGIRPSGAYHRRHQNRAGGDVGEGLSRSLVGAGAAGRSADAEARRALPQS